MNNIKNLWSEVIIFTLAKVFFFSLTVEYNKNIEIDKWFVTVATLMEEEFTK